MHPSELPANAGVLSYVGQGLPPAEVVVASPPPDVDRFRLGAHPDIVARLWDELAPALGVETGALVAGGPALIDPGSGRILAVALGTQYALWLTGSGLAQAEAIGYQTVHEFRSVGRSLDLAARFGPGWLFGAWNANEGTWLEESRRSTNL